MVGVERLMAALDGAMGLAAGGLFFVVAWYIVLDVIGRNYAGFYSGATDEISGYALAVGTSWAMAFTLRRKGHVVIDVMTTRLSPRLQRWLEMLALATMLGFAAILAFFAWRLAWGSGVMDARSVGIIATPLVVPQALMATGFTVFALEALVLLAGAALNTDAGRRNGTGLCAGTDGAPPVHTDGGATPTTAAMRSVQARPADSDR
jgi:TRAP-type C4-dicarboxylate transport system permease small subunit